MVERRARRGPGAHTGVGRRRGTGRPDRPPRRRRPPHRHPARHPRQLRAAPCRSCAHSPCARSPCAGPRTTPPRSGRAPPRAPVVENGGRPAAPDRPRPAAPQPARPKPRAARPEPTEPPTDLARVARALDEGRKLAERQNRPDLGNHLEQARKRLGEQVLSVAVVGEFKRGKSTLVNALLQTDVCPTDADIVTAVPTVVRYGAEPSAAALLEPVERPTADNTGGRRRRGARRRRPARRARLRGRRRELAAPPALGRGPPPPPPAARPGWASSTPPASAAWSRRTASSPSARCAPRLRRDLRDRRLAGADRPRRSPSSARRWSAAPRRSAS